MFFCFQLKLLTVASACAAGYAVEHMTFHITKIIGSTTDLLKDSFWGIPRWELLEYIFFPLIYLLIAATLGVHSAKSNAFKHEDHRLTLPFLAIIASTIGLTRVTNAFGEMASIPVSMYAIACCIMALAVQLILFREINLQHENNTIKLLWQEDRRQYEIMKATIDTINIKQLYAQVPYIQGGVEKSAVQLAAYDITGEIAPGKSETLTIHVDMQDIASYDMTHTNADGTKGTWILDAGDYYFTVANGSHNALNNILAKQGKTVANTKGLMDADGDVKAVYHYSKLAEKLIAS